MTKNPTVTDDKKFKVSVLDEARFKALDVNKQKMFVFLRNGMLEIFPLNDKKTYDESTLNFAENYAFITLQSFDVIINEIIEAKINTLLTQVETLIATTTATLTASISAVATPAATPV